MVLSEGGIVELCLTLVSKEEILGFIKLCLILTNKRKILKFIKNIGHSTQ